MSAADPPRLRGLIGAEPGRVKEVLGRPDAERRASGDRWLLYRRPDCELRVRCGGPDGQERVASWTLTYAGRGPATLREAADPLGLWPAVAPDARAEEAEGPMIRRPLPAPEDGETHSFTAGVVAGAFSRLTAYDEAPDWPGAGSEG